MSWLEFLNMSGIVNWNQNSIYWVTELVTVKVTYWFYHLLKIKFAMLKNFPPDLCLLPLLRWKNDPKKVQKFLLNMQQYQCIVQFCTSIVKTNLFDIFSPKKQQKNLHTSKIDEAGRLQDHVELKRHSLSHSSQIGLSPQSTSFSQSQAPPYLSGLNTWKEVKINLSVALQLADVSFILYE